MMQARSAARASVTVAAGIRRGTAPGSRCKEVVAWAVLPTMEVHRAAKVGPDLGAAESADLAHWFARRTVRPEYHADPRAYK